MSSLPTAQPEARKQVTRPTNTSSGDCCGAILQFHTSSSCLGGSARRGREESRAWGPGLMPEAGMRNESTCESLLTLGPRRRDPSRPITSYWAAGPTARMTSLGQGWGRGERPRRALSSRCPLLAPPTTTTTASYPSTRRYLFPRPCIRLYGRPRTPCFLFSSISSPPATYRYTVSYAPSAMQPLATSTRPLNSRRHFLSPRTSSPSTSDAPPQTT